MMYLIRLPILVLLFATFNPTLSVAQASQNANLKDFTALLSTSVTRHLNLLLDKEGNLRPLKGKATDASTAIAFYRMYEMYGNRKYREVALLLANQILTEMKQTKFGVLYVKDKEDKTGEKLAGGGPPAFGFYTANLAYIYSKEGHQNSEIIYLATVLNNYPYNEKGWWASTIDIKTGEPKNGLSKPTPVNKNASMAMAAGLLSGYIKNIDPVLSEQLRKKADQCIYTQIIPAQAQNGFWHYGLNGNDPKDKDVLGYFMLTTDALIKLFNGNESYRTERLKAALDNAGAFANKTITPITEPNNGMLDNQFTSGTPTQYKMSGEIKRGYALGSILLEKGYTKEAITIINAWSSKFPYGNSGSDGAHALDASISMLTTIKNRQSN